MARNSRDRKLILAATALEEASESEDDDRFLTLATDFTRRYPQLGDGHALLAQALQRKGQFEAAVKSLDYSVQLGVDEMHAHMLRGAIYDDAGQSGKAIQEFTVLTQSQDPELRQLSLVCRAWLLMQIEDLDQALSDSNSAIATLPDQSAYLVRGHVHRRKGDFQACLQDYTRAIQLQPNSADFLENRAEVYEELGRTDEAYADRTAATAAESKASQPQNDVVEGNHPGAEAGTRGRRWYLWAAIVGLALIAVGFASLDWLVLVVVLGAIAFIFAYLGQAYRRR